MSEAPGGGPIRVGVIGVGAMGTSHVRTLARWIAGAQVVAVSDVDTDSAAGIAAEVGAHVHGSGAELIADDAVDAVLVASPDPTHEELTLACLAAGKPVLCEKPLAVEQTGTRRVVDAEVALGRRLVQVGFMRRYDPAYVELRHLVATGALGVPRVVHCLHRNAAAHPSATSEGIVSNSMIHEIDVVPWLLDDPVAAITVAARRAGDGSLRDPQVALMETVEGVLVTAEVFVNAGYGYEVGCEVVGTDGTARLTPPYGVRRRQRGTDGVEVSADFVARFRDAYRIELADWVEGLRRGVVSGPSAWDGHRATVVAAAGVTSLRSGQRVGVPAEPVPRLYARDRR